MKDYILLQNMLELAQQLGNVTNKELLIREIEKPMNELHGDTMREMFIDVKAIKFSDNELNEMIIL